MIDTAWWLVVLTGTLVGVCVGMIGTSGALLICMLSFFGGRFVQQLPDLYVKRTFGAALPLVLLRMLFWSR